MLRTILITTAATLIAALWGIAIRGEVAFGGEMILPALAIAYTVITPKEIGGK